MTKKKKIRPIIKFNGGAGAILCNKCRKIIKEPLSDKEFEGETSLLYCDSCIIDIVHNFPTKYEEGFIAEEQEELVKLFPNINTEKYHDALSGITCVMRDGKLVIYHCDIITALKCGTQNRQINIYEWD